MKKKVYFVFGIIFILVVIFLIVQIKPLQKKEVCIENKKCFEVEIADTSELMSKGLSRRDFLDENKGMLFIFESLSSSNFWMKDMRFSLDMIGINDKKEITQIIKNAKPCEEECPIFYFNKTKYVLEISSGLSEKYGFEKGDELILKV
jgi:hypothetical protein